MAKLILLFVGLTSAINFYPPKDYSFPFGDPDSFTSSTTNRYLYLSTSCYRYYNYTDANQTSDGVLDRLDASAVYYGDKVYNSTTTIVNGLFPDTQELGLTFNSVYYFAKRTGNIVYPACVPNNTIAQIKGEIFDHNSTAGDGCRPFMLPSYYGKYFPINKGFMVRHTGHSQSTVLPTIIFTSATSNYVALVSYDRTGSTNQYDMTVQVCDFKICDYPFVTPRWYVNAGQPLYLDGNDQLYWIKKSGYSCLVNVTVPLPKFSGDDYYYTFFMSDFKGFRVYSSIDSATEAASLLVNQPLDFLFESFKVVPVVTYLMASENENSNTYPKLVSHVWWLKETSYLIRFDGGGVITNAAHCEGRPFDRALCMQQTFNLPEGLYNAIPYVEQPQLKVVEYGEELDDCQFTDLLTPGPNGTFNMAWPLFYINSPTYCKQDYSVACLRSYFQPRVIVHTLRGCKFDPLLLLNLLTANQASCLGVDANRLSNSCFGGLRYAFMPILKPPHGLSLLEQTSPSSWVKYVYKPDISTPMCVISGKLDPRQHPQIKDVKATHSTYWPVGCQPQQTSVCRPSGADLGNCFLDFDVLNVQNRTQECPSACLNRRACGAHFVYKSAPSPYPGASHKPLVTPGFSYQYQQLPCGPHIPCDQITEPASLDCSKVQWHKGKPEFYCANETNGEPKPNQWSGYYALVVNVFEESGSMVCPNTFYGKPKVADNLYKCVSYDLHGVTGTGTFYNCTVTIPKDSRFAYGSDGILSAYRADNGVVYCVRPCVSSSIATYMPRVFTNETTTPVSVVVPHLYRDVACEVVQTTTMFDSTLQPIDLPMGCLVGARDARNVSGKLAYCDTNNGAIGMSLCVHSTEGIRLHKRSILPRAIAELRWLPFAKEEPTPIFNGTISLPKNFTFVQNLQYVQTQHNKVSIDCNKYVCNGHPECLALLKQYGSFCIEINSALSGVARKQDDIMMKLIDSIRTKTPSVVPDFGEFSKYPELFDPALKQNLPHVGINRGQRGSFVEDLLFDKIVMADPGYMNGYAKCIESKKLGEDGDIQCIQKFNGVSVLPPVMSDGLIGKYTAGLALGMSIGGFGFGVPATMGSLFATSVFARINGLGVAQNVLMENQKQIANKFNQALTQITQGFATTSSAIMKLQDAVNRNAVALNNLVSELTNNFGAISAAISEILKRLDTLESNAQIDRLINGRLAALNTFVTQSLIEMKRVEEQAQLAIELINECVKSQSMRRGFCGVDKHVYSVVQKAPLGFAFIHFGLAFEDYVELETAAGLCVTLDSQTEISYYATPQQVGISAKFGVFIRDATHTGGQWMVSSPQYLAPENITIDKVIVGSCETNFTETNLTVSDITQPTTNQTFLDELLEFYKNVSSSFPGLELSNISAQMVNVNAEIAKLNQIVQTLNDSYIKLEDLGKYEQYIKWPWYVWLGFIAGLVAIALVLIMMCCCTGCCTSCWGKIKVPRLRPKYDEYEFEKLHYN